MKSTPQEIVETSCKNCIFAQYEGDTQTGCDANRLEKFLKKENQVVAAYDDTHKFYVIKRLCNLYRLPTWNNGMKDLELAKQQSSLSFNIIVHLEDCSKENINHIAQVIKNIDYPENKLRFLILFPLSATSSERYDVLHHFQHNKNTEVAMYLQKDACITNHIMGNDSANHINCNIENIDNINVFLHKINQYVNDEIRGGLIFTYNKLTAISSLAFKMMYPTLYFEYDVVFPQMVESVKNFNLFVNLEENCESKENK
jgi:hypothetical protein